MEAQSKDGSAGTPAAKETAANNKTSLAGSESNYDKNNLGGKNTKKNVHNRKSTRASTIHSVIMKEHKVDVYKKYVETEVLGNGSMGHVAKVKLKEDYHGSIASKGQAAADAEKAKRAVLKAVEGTDSSLRTSNADENNSTSNQSNITNNSNCYALKSIQLDRVSTAFVEELKNEINILKAMDHPNIVKLQEVFSHKKQIYLILELCDGGDLYTRLPYTEKDSAYITGKLLSAIKYMHDHGIVHRDLKFENIMFENKGPHAEIKVIDFGLSKKFASNKLGVMKEGVGTLYSMAPQVLQGIYNAQADMWSVGVITYMLLSSHRPFYNKKRKIMIDRIMRCDYTFKKNYWDPISNESKDFIDHLLVLDPKVRYTPAKAQAHEWLHKEFNIEDRKPTESVRGRVTHNLLAYKNNLSLKKLALNVIAHRSSTEEILQLRKAFDAFDTSNDGIITSEEFQVALEDKCCYKSEEIKEMFDSIDINKNGHIMYTEFIAATLEAQGQLDEDRIAEAFDRLDTDDTGYISKANMLEFLGGTDSDAKDVERMIEQADIDNCGQVSFDEFLAMFRSENERESSIGCNPLLSSLKHFDEFDDRTSASGTTDELVGIDAVIPGGKFDTERVEEKLETMEEEKE
jgi:serine/threonine protein kinase